jgi:hypothetical protein
VSPGRTVGTGTGKNRCTDADRNERTYREVYPGPPDVPGVAARPVPRAEARAARRMPRMTFEEPRRELQPRDAVTLAKR